MGNLQLSTSLFRTDATSSQRVSTGNFVAREISNGITYYYRPFPEAQPQGAHPSISPETLYPVSTLSPLVTALSSSALLHSELSPQGLDASQIHPYPSSTPRPLVLFFSWLGAQPASVAKYRDLYLERGMDVLLVQSRVTHFLWPRWGLDYGLKVVNILEQPAFSERLVLVHASSIGGYTFTQMLTHITEGREGNGSLANRVMGHVYDSLVVGTLEQMAIGLGKTLVPQLESLVKNAARFYFWLFKSHTTDFYERAIQVFHQSPITSPALFFFCENDALSNSAALEKVIALWRKRGVAVVSKKWNKSIHAAHLRCHPEEYLHSLQHFINSLPITSNKS